jgi:hypothetical protein
MGEEGYPDGRWVKVNDSDTVAVISDPLDRIEPKADQWLNKDFFKIEKPKTITATFPAATNSWKLTKETEAGEWKLADAKPGEQLDNSKATGVANPLNTPSFNDVATSSKPEELGLDKATVVNVETFDNFAYTIKVGSKTNHTFPLTMSVSAQIAKERTPGKDEKPEDKTRLDKEFADNQKKLEEKLEQERVAAEQRKQEEELRKAAEAKKKADQKKAEDLKKKKLAEEKKKREEAKKKFDASKLAAMLDKIPDSPEAPQKALIDRSQDDRVSHR